MTATNLSGHFRGPLAQVPRADLVHAIRGVHNSEDRRGLVLDHSRELSVYSVQPTQRDKQHSLRRYLRHPTPRKCDRACSETRPSGSVNRAGPQSYNSGCIGTSNAGSHAPSAAEIATRRPDQHSSTDFIRASPPDFAQTDAPRNPTPYDSIGRRYCGLMWEGDAATQNCRAV